MIGCYHYPHLTDEQELVLVWAFHFLLKRCHSPVLRRPVASLKELVGSLATNGLNKRKPMPCLYSFIHSFIHVPIVPKYLLCFSYCTRHWGSNGESKQIWAPPSGSRCPVGEREVHEIVTHRNVE